MAREGQTLYTRIHNKREYQFLRATFFIGEPLKNLLIKYLDSDCCAATEHTPHGQEVMGSNLAIGVYLCRLSLMGTSTGDSTLFIF